MKQLIILFAMLASLSTYALHEPSTDKPGKISGTVIDKNLQQPIPYVTIVIKTINGEIITGGVTDDDGKFIIEEIPEGKSKVSIQYIG